MPERDEEPDLDASEYKPAADDDELVISDDFFEEEDVEDLTVTDANASEDAIAASSLEEATPEPSAVPEAIPAAPAAPVAEEPAAIPEASPAAPVAEEPASAPEPTPPQAAIEEEPEIVLDFSADGDDDLSPLAPEVAAASEPAAAVPEPAAPVAAPEPVAAVAAAEPVAPATAPEPAAAPQREQQIVAKIDTLVDVLGTLAEVLARNAIADATTPTAAPALPSGEAVTPAVVDIQPPAATATPELDPVVVDIQPPAVPAPIAETEQPLAPAAPSGTEDDLGGLAEINLPEAPESYDAEPVTGEEMREDSVFTEQEPSLPLAPETNLADEIVLPDAPDEDLLPPAPEMLTEALPQEPAVSYEEEPPPVIEAAITPGANDLELPEPPSLSEMEDMGFDESPEPAPEPSTQAIPMGGLRSQPVQTAAPTLDYKPTDVMSWGGEITADQAESIAQSTAVDSLRAEAVGGAVASGNVKRRETRGGSKPKFLNIPTKFNQPLIISFTSPKGGVGKTTTALNVGAFLAKSLELSKNPARVLVFDGDTANGNAALRAGGEIKPNMLDLLQYMEDNKDVGSYDEMRNFVHAHPRVRNLDILPAPESIDVIDQLTDQDLNDIMITLAKFYQIIVIDTGTQIIERTNQAWLAFSHQVYLMVEPDIACLQSTLTYAKRVRKLNLVSPERFRVVMIRSDIPAQIDPVKSVEKLFSWVPENKMFFIKDYQRDTYVMGNIGDFLVLESGEYASEILEIAKSSLSQYDTDSN